MLFEFLYQMHRLDIDKFLKNPFQREHFCSLENEIRERGKFDFDHHFACLTGPSSWIVRCRAISELAQAGLDLPNKISRDLRPRITNWKWTFCLTVTRDIFFARFHLPGLRCRARAGFSRRSRENHTLCTWFRPCIAGQDFICPPREAHDKHLFGSSRGPFFKIVQSGLWPGLSFRFCKCKIWQIWPRKK